MRDDGRPSFIAAYRIDDSDGLKPSDADGYASEMQRIRG